MSSLVFTPLFFGIVIFYIFPIIISHEDTNNKNDNENFFNNFNFGNLLWLDDTNTTSEIEKTSLIIFFYANWCQYSYKFMPEFIKASNYAEEKNIPIKFAKIDVSKSQKIIEKFKIISVPIVILFYKEEYYLFKEERTKEKIIEFINKILKNNIIVVEKIEEINKIIESSPLVALCTIKNDNKMLYKSFVYYSKQETDNIKFVLCRSDECKKTYYEDIILFKKFDEKKNTYTKYVGRIADADKNSVKDFMEIFGIEVGVLIKQKILDFLLINKRSILFYFRDSSNETQTQYDNKIKEIGLELRKKKMYTFLSDIKGEPIYENLVNSFSIKIEDLPVLLLYDLKNAINEENVYVYRISSITSKELNLDFINQFINQDKNNNTNNEKKLEYFDSDNNLENYNTDGLYRITDQNYETDVINGDKNVVLTIIEDSFSLPETEKILSIMKNLSKKYSKKGIMFAYIDASKYQINNLDFKGDIPPMVYLFFNEKTQKIVIKLEHPNFENIEEDEVIKFINNAFKLDTIEKNDDL